MTDYTLWEVILNGDSPIPTKVIDSVVQPVAPTTAQQRLARKNELKARGTLLMALLDKHQLKFNIHKDAKTLMEAIEKRFGRNKETKKVQKTLLKQQYENFTGSSSESLDQIHDRLQKLISQLEILRESLFQEDINLKFLRSLPTEWRTHTLTWRNKADLEDQSLDDLFNSLKIYESKVKSSSTTSPTTQNIDFMSSQNTNSTNESVSVIASVFAASTKVHVSALPNVDTLSDVVIYSFFASQSNSPLLDNDDLKQIHAGDLEEMNLKWQMAMLTMRARRFLQRTGRNLGANGTTSIGFDMSKCDGVGSYDWSFQAEEEPTNYALMAFTSSSSSSSDNKVATCSKACTKAYATLQSHYDKLTNDLRKSQFDVISYKTCLESVEAIILVYQQNETVFEEDIKLLKLDVHLRDNALVELRKKFEKAEQERDEPSVPIIEDWVSNLDDESEGEPMTAQKTPSFFQTTEHVKTPRPSVKPVEHLIPDANLKTDIPKSRGHGNSRNRKACFVWNMSYPSDFEEINGGYVAFGRNPKGGKITGKGKIRTGKLDFNDVYFVKELKFNLFSVSQMCDKKNNVLFTDTKCIVLSPNFKLSDENQGLLRVPRENNMYNVDLKNIIPSGDLTCLFAKATLDESNLWHKRLGHINFKTMNKLVKDPLGKFDRKADEGFLVGYYNTDDDATFEVKEPESEVHVSPSSSAKTKKHDDKTKREAKGKSHVELSTGFRNLIPAVGQISTNSTNTFSAAGPSNTIVSPTLEKSLYVDPSQYPNDQNMLALEDITYFDDEEDVGAEANFSNLETNINVSPIPTTRVYKDHPVTQIIGDLSSAPETRSMTKIVKEQSRLTQINNDDFHTCMFACFLSQEEPKRVHQAFKDPSWIEAMQEELLQFKMQKEEGIDYEEVFSPVARIKDIRLFLAYSSFMGFMVHQMDVKSDFLYGTIEEEVYVCQPLEFKDPDYPDKRGKIDQTLFIKKQKDGKSASTLIDTEKPLLKDPDSEDVDVHTYSAMDSKSVAGLWVNDVVRLQAIIDRKKVIITEDTVHQALHLDDAESIDCLPNEEIFAELARMGYEKPSIKLTFYKAFFSAQWKFLIHTILQCMSAKRTAWNEFSSSMASTVICLGTGMLVQQQAANDVDDVVADNVPADDVADVVADDVIADVVAHADAERTPPSPTPTTTPPTPQQEEIREEEKVKSFWVEKIEEAKIDADKDVTLEEVVVEVDIARDAGVEKNADDDEPEPAELKEVIEEVTTAKLMTDLVTVATTTITTAPIAARRKKGEPKPLKKQAQIEQDEVYARELEAELNKNINWDDVIERVKRKEKEDNANMAGFKMDFFKGMSYDDIRPIFEKYFNSNVAFLEKSEKQLEEEGSRALKRKTDSSEQQAAKKQKLDEEVEELKKHLQIVPNDEDDVYTEATPLALKVPVVDYQIYTENNKPYYKIIRADGTHQLFLSFLSLLRNFDREHLEVLWKIVQERFASSKPNNF
nr:ribonuclease H-like domain-containing protein [Tanacetum cinerariifolium]